MHFQNSLGQTLPRPLEHGPRALMHPINWLLAGVRDLIATPAASLAYGLLVTALGLVLLVLGSAYIYFLIAAVSGFLLIGPVMAAGLCELSRLRDQGEAADFDHSLDVLARKRTPLAHYSVLLLGVGLIWFIVSDVLLRAVIGEPAPAFDRSLWGGLLAVLSTREILVYVAVGGVIAAAVFAVSVVTIPALIDRPLRAREAMALSLAAVRTHPATMAVWAALIVALTALGFATGLLGMIVIYPLLGHATWHAYRELLD
ncbi:MAG: DUF2189 domain-containing protein [Gammaproteobacteria bacterium]